MFSIQEGEQGFRSDKLFCKQPPQILPAGGSPSARCFVYQSARIVLKGHWSTAPCHFPPSSYRKPGRYPPSPRPPHPHLPTLNHKIKVIISSHPHQHFYFFFPFPPSSSSFSMYSFMCFKGSSLKTSSFSPSTSATLQTVVLFLRQHIFTKGILLLNLVFWPWCVLQASRGKHGRAKRKSNKGKVYHEGQKRINSMPYLLTRTLFLLWARVESNCGADFLLLLHSFQWASGVSFTSSSLLSSSTDQSLLAQIYFPLTDNASSQGAVRFPSLL